MQPAPKKINVHFYAAGSIKQQREAFSSSPFSYNSTENRKCYKALALAGDTFVSTVSALPNGLSFEKSIRMGAATKIEE